MDYAQALCRLLRSNRMGGRPDASSLVNFTTACDSLNKTLLSSLQLPCMHVVGTNGKGSVVWKTCDVVSSLSKHSKNDGMVVGAYTSPHVGTIRERIGIWTRGVKEELREDEWVELVEYVSPVAKEFQLSPFEATTLLAFAAFSKKKVGCAIVEAGMGGAGDATNVLLDPKVVVLTSVAMDHAEVLGPTLMDICRNKAGAFKKGTHIVLGPDVPGECITEAERIAISVGAASFEVVDSLSNEENDDDRKNTINTRLATLCARRLTGNSELEASLNVIPPCRFQVVRDDALSKNVVLDVAHNPAALASVITHFGRTFDFSKSILVFGLAKDKDEEACIHALCTNKWKSVIFTRPSSFVGREFCDPHKLLFASSSSNARIITPVSVAVREALIQTEDAVLVCGSHNLMAESLIELGHPVQRDPFDTNEGGHIPPPQ